MTTTRQGNNVRPSSSSALVSISRVVPVYPKHIVQPAGRVLNLSNLDRQCPILMYGVSFYNPSQAFKGLSLSSVFSSLKLGLEETLNLWYPAAGRLRVNQSDGKLNLWCNNEGAIIVEAHTPLRVSQLGDLSQYNEFFEKLVYKPTFHADFSNMPLVVAQVTKFGCGGYSIGLGTSHSLFDGVATYEFLSAWASNSEILKGIIRHGGGEVAKPVHERGILLSESLETPKGTMSINMPSNSRTSNHDHQQTKAVAIEHLYHLIMQEASEYKGLHPQNIGASEQNNYVLMTYHVSSSLIDYLKRKHFSASTDDHSPIFSTFEVLASHLWKARTKALGLGMRKEKKVCLQFAVDTRNKTVPPLPKGFSGNAYVLASVMMSVREVEEASYVMIVEKIREAKNRVNHAYVKAYVETLESGGAQQQGSLPPLKELTLVSDWTRMPFHNVGFFHGKAACVSPLASPVPQAAYFMPNPSDNGGVDVRIGLHPQTITAFSDDFLSRGQ